MKKLLATTIASAACIGAFGQGAIQFYLDSNHAIYFTSDTAKMIPVDANATCLEILIAGQGAYRGGVRGGIDGPGTIESLPSAVVFTASLFGGPSVSSMTLQTTTAIADGNDEGNIVPATVNNATMFPGTMWYWDVRVTSTLWGGLGRPAVLR
jgi:hypothetical protein